MCVCVCVCVFVCCGGGYVSIYSFIPAWSPLRSTVLDLTLMSVQTSVESHCSFPRCYEEGVKGGGCSGRGGKGSRIRRSF